MYTKYIKMASNQGNLKRDIIGSNVQIKGVEIIDEKRNIKNIHSAILGSVYSRSNLTIPVNPTSVGRPGSIAYNSTTESLMISNGTSWNGAGNNLPGSVLVFKPGTTDTNNNVFGVWQDLYNVLVTIEGPKTINFDDAELPFDDPIVIPAGTWNMEDVTWEVKLCSLHTPPTLFTRIEISDGATVHGLCGISGPLIVDYKGTTVPAFIFNTAPESRHASFDMSYGAQLLCSGTQPFFRIDAGFCEIITTYSSKIYGVSPPSQFGNPVSTVPPILINDADAQLILVLGSACLVEDNTLNGTLGFVLFIRLVPGAITSVPPVQPFYTGGLGVSSLYTSPDTYVRAVAPTSTDDESKGYKIGDMWIDNIGNKFYVAISVASGSALWNGPY